MFYQLVSVVNGANVFPTPSGNVGIGTTSPQERLHLNDAWLRFDNSDWTMISMDGYDSSNGSNKTLKMHYGYAGNELRFGRFGDNHGTWEANPYKFDLDAPDNSFVVGDSGNLGIGVYPSVGVGFEVRKDAIKFATSNNKAHSWFPHNDGRVYITGNGDGSGNGDIILRSYSDVSGYSEKFRLEGDSGNVGIGTNSPISTLDVAGRITLSGSDGYVKRNNDADGILLSGGSGWVNTGALIWLKGAQNSTDPSEATFYTGGQHAMRIDANQNIGIGTASPKEKLQIGNGFAFHDGGHKVIAFRSYFDGGWKNLSSIKPVSVGENSLGDIVFGFGSGTTSGQSSNLETKVIFKNSGNVGIGTTNPSHKLSVNGTIRAKEVIVESDWSDYVFEKDYVLAPLPEVEAHIEANGHLPGIPSAFEIEVNGAKLSELVTLQMAKIEELTLHLIEKEKIIEHQSQQLASILARLDVLEK